MALAAAKFEGLDKLQAKLTRMASTAKNPQPLMDAAGRYMMVTGIPLQFREGGPGWKRLRSRSGSPLLDTGRYRDSWRYRAGKALTLFTSFVGAPVHQYGATIVPRFKKLLSIPIGGTRYHPKSFRLVKSVTIPARPVKFRDKDLAAIASRWGKILTGEGKAQ